MKADDVVGKSTGGIRWPVPLVTAALIAMVLAGCDEPLQHGLDEHEANTMVVTLNRHGLDAQKIRDPADAERWAVEVPRGQRVEAWSTLQQEGLPRPTSGGFDDFYPGGGLIPTANEERVVLQYATARELQSSLLRVDGVVDAHVHLVLPDKPRVQMTDDEASEPRASVLMQWRAADGEPPLDEDAVRALVSGAVEDLRREAVYVVSTPVSAPEPRTGQGGEQQLGQVGPIAVAPSSEGPLKGLIALMAAVIIALSSGLVYVLLKSRRGGRQEGV